MDRTAQQPQSARRAPARTRDDFFQVTRRADFDALIAQHRNFVLQSPSLRDHGSLSVRFAFGRYANVEAELGGPATRKRGRWTSKRSPRWAPPVDRRAPPDRRVAAALRCIGSQLRAQTARAEQPGQLATVLRRWLGHLYDEIVRVLQQVSTMPEPLPREARPADCRRAVGPSPTSPHWTPQGTESPLPPHARSDAT